jgi:hypothetical protein
MGSLDRRLRDLEGRFVADEEALAGEAMKETVSRLPNEVVDIFYEALERLLYARGEDSDGPVDLETTRAFLDPADEWACDVYLETFETVLREWGVDK